MLTTASAVAATAATLTTILNNGTTNTTVPTYWGGDYSEEGEVGPDPKKFLLLKKVLFSLIFIFSILGNALLISSILFIKRLRHMKSNSLILHLALCDVLISVFSIPFNLVILDGDGSYPFNEAACKTLWPLATYATNCSALTLVCIAIERYLAINSLCVRYEKALIFIFIALVHAISGGSVVPYMITLTYEEYFGEKYCYEEWFGTREQKIYTCVLFVLQYGIPFILIVSLYGATWWKIMQRNKRMIKVSEEYERKIAREQNDTTTTTTIATNSKQKTIVKFKEDSSSEQSSSISVGSEAKEEVTSGEENNNRCKSKQILNGGAPKQEHSFIDSKIHKIRKIRNIRNIKLLKKPKFISHTAYVRHRQTIRTLKMFTTVVVVFAVMAFPNQIVWLLADFAPGQKVSMVIVQVCVFLTYTNSLLNCWIYGGFNKHFRKAYKEILLMLFPCFKRCCKDPLNQYGYQSTFRSTGSTAMSSSRPSVPDDSEANNEFMERQRAFTDMFQDHLNNFEKYQHLYNTVEDEEEEKVREEENENANLLSPATPARKTTIASLITAISSPSRKASQISPPSFNVMVLPIIPFLPGTPNLKTDRRRASTSAVDSEIKKYKNSSRPNSAINMDFIDKENLIPRETLKERKRRAVSASELAKLGRTPSASTPTTPSSGRKRSIWAMLSPRVHKKNQMVKSFTVDSMPIPLVNILNEEKDMMITASEIKVQVARAVSNVQMSNVTRSQTRSNFKLKSPSASRRLGSPTILSKLKRPSFKRSFSSGSASKTAPSPSKDSSTKQINRHRVPYICTVSSDQPSEACETIPLVTSPRPTTLSLQNTTSQPPGLQQTIAMETKPDGKSDPSIYSSALRITRSSNPDLLRSKITREKNNNNASTNSLPDESLKQLRSPLQRRKEQLEKKIAQHNKTTVSESDRRPSIMRLSKTPVVKNIFMKYYEDQPIQTSPLVGKINRLNKALNQSNNEKSTSGLREKSHVGEVPSNEHSSTLATNETISSLNEQLILNDNADSKASTLPRAKRLQRMRRNGSLEAPDMTELLDRQEVNGANDERRVALNYNLSPRGFTRKTSLTAHVQTKKPNRSDINNL